MKSTGMVRRIDKLGRVVVPKEMRRNLDLPEGSPMEFFVEGKDIIMRKYIPGCVVCGKISSRNRTAGNTQMCEDCLNLLTRG